MTEARYRGRFAPSPTGDLHLGSLVAAVASYADARHAGGDWLVRIEDIDETRRRNGAEHRILGDLERLGMYWDATPVRQSARKSLYRDALDALKAVQAVYPCICTRREINAVAKQGKEGAIYPGTCRQLTALDSHETAWRVKVGNQVVRFNDLLCGNVEQNLFSDIGDYIVRRRDGFFAYQLAVVVDDHDQGITDIVRGADLLWSTPRQLWLQQLLQLPTPRYAHVPMVLNERGKKLSKRTEADPVRNTDAVDALLAAWQFLGQTMPDDRPDNVTTFWRWAGPAWRLNQVPSDCNA